MDILCQLGEADMLKAGNGGSPDMLHTLHACSMVSGHQRETEASL